MAGLQQPAFMLPELSLVFPFHPQGLGEDMFLALQVLKTKEIAKRKILWPNILI